MVCIDFCMNGTFTFDGVASSGFQVICIDMNNRYLSKSFWRRYSAAKLSMLHFDSAGWGKLSFLVSHRCKWFKKKKTQRRIQDPTKHLSRSFIAKIIYGFQLFTIFAKTLHHRYLTKEVVNVRRNNCQNNRDSATNFFNQNLIKTKHDRVSLQILNPKTLQGEALSCLFYIR